MRAELSWRGRTGTVRVDGADRARLHRAVLRERARAELSGADWTLASHRGVVTATDPGASPRHSARGEGVRTRRWTLRLGPRALRMDAAGSRSWRLVDVATGAGVGEVCAVARRVEAWLPADTSLDAVVFVLWVADVRARRRADPLAHGWCTEVA